MLNFFDEQSGGAERGDDEATGIISVHDSGFMVNGSDAWYTLDGRRLDKQPTAKGLYIHGGRKVIVK